MIDPLILKTPISLQKTYKLSSVLAAFEVYPLLVVIYSILFQKEQERNSRRQTQSNTEN